METIQVLISPLEALDTIVELEIIEGEMIIEQETKDEPKKEETKKEITKGSSDHLEHLELGAVDVFAMTWALDTSKDELLNNFQKYFTILSSICVNRGDAGVYIVGTKSDLRTDDKECFTKDDLKKIYDDNLQEVDFFYGECTAHNATEVPLEQNSLLLLMADMVREKRKKKFLIKAKSTI